MTGTRAPEYMSPKRIAELACLPLFHNLKGRKVLVAGHSLGAIWKAELVAAAGAEVTLLAGVGLVLEQELDNIPVEFRNWAEEDFQDAALAILSTHSDEEAQKFVDAARKFGVPVNVIDKPKYCDFQFGAIVNRSPLIIGIATHGAAPALGQVLRGRLEAMLPQSIANWVKAAKEWRPIVKARELDFGQRRSFWHRFANRALNEPNHIPTETDLNTMLGDDKPTLGEVALVGAGPGDPELLTLKAMRALQRAEVVLFDDLVEPAILDYARREAQLIGVGKRGRRPSCAQEEISSLLVKYAKEGKYVVRIKGGDPLIFGRATEEINACREAGIKIEIIPGISASQGVASSLGFSLTDREYAQRVQFVTGAGKKGGLPPEINWAAIADKNTTTFIYMPRNTLPDFVKNAIGAGIDADLPAALVIEATRPDQKAIISTIAKLPETIKNIPSNGPEMIVIGNVLRNIDGFDKLIKG